MRKSIVPQAPANTSGINLFAPEEQAPAEHAPPAAPPETAVRVQVRELVLDDRIQPRERMDPARSRELADLLREAAVEGQDTATVYKDPLIVYVDPVDGTKRVTEGYHRTDGARLSEVTPELMAILRPGGVAEARLWASGSNAAHGKPRAQEDLHRVLMWYLDSPAGTVTLTPEVLLRLPAEQRPKIPVGRPIAVSDHLVAALCQCAQSTVTRQRNGLKRDRAAAGPATEPAHQLHLGDPPAKRMGLDGKERRLPQRKPQPAPTDAPDEDAAAAEEVEVRPLWKESLFPRAEEQKAEPGGTEGPHTVPAKAFMAVSGALRDWRQRAEGAGLSPVMVMRLLLREVASMALLGGPNARMLDRILRYPEIDEVLLHPFEEAALFFVVHQNGVTWDRLQAQGADDGEILSTLQKAMGQRGAHAGERLRVEWRGGKSPEVRLLRLGSKIPPMELKGQELLSAIRCALQIPSAGAGRAG